MIFFPFSVLPSPSALERVLPPSLLLPSPDSHSTDHFLSVLILSANNVEEWQLPFQLFTSCLSFLFGHQSFTNLFNAYSFKLLIILFKRKEVGERKGVKKLPTSITSSAHLYHYRDISLTKSELFLKAASSKRIVDSYGCL